MGLAPSERARAFPQLHSLHYYIWVSRTKKLGLEPVLKRLPMHIVLHNLKNTAYLDSGCGSVPQLSAQSLSCKFLFLLPARTVWQCDKQLLNHLIRQTVN